MDNLINNNSQEKKKSFFQNETVQTFTDNIKKFYQLYSDVSGKFGIMGLNIDIVDEIIEESKTVITDYYVEGNEARQEHISLTPNMFTISGYITELKYTNSTFKTIAKKITSTLGTVEVFKNVFVGVKKSVNQLTDKNNKSKNYINGAENLFANVQDLLIGMTEQAKARVFIKNLQNNRTPVSLNTPWGYIKNYYIENVIFTQGKTRDATLIKMTLKECLFIQTEYTTITKEDLNKVLKNLKDEAKESTGIDKNKNNQNYTK